MYIYTITNTVNGKVYVGQTIQEPVNRFYHHKSALKLRKHGNLHLQAAWYKSGESAFEFEVIARARHQLELNELECYFIALFQSASPEFGYNKRAGGANGQMSAESRRRMSESRKGKPSPRKGRKASEETRQRISKAQIGRTASDSTKAKMSEAHKRRREMKCLNS